MEFKHTRDLYQSQTRGIEMTDPRMSQKEFDSKMDKIKVCGANRGPHDYIPISWQKTTTSEHVTMLLCRVCFNRVSVSTLHEQFEECKV